MIEILNHKILFYSQPLRTEKVSGILQSVRQRMRNGKGYDIEFAFDEDCENGDLCGALRNPPSLENLVIHDHSAVMDLWFYSPIFQAKKIGLTFRAWTSICDRLMAEKMINEAFLTVGFRTMFDDLELFYRPTNDLDCAFEVKLR